MSFRLQPISHRRDVDCLRLFCKYFQGSCSNGIFFLLPRSYESTGLAIRSRYFTDEIARWNRKFCLNSFFFSFTSHVSNSLRISSFLAFYNLQRCKYNVNRHLLSSWIPFFYCLCSFLKPSYFRSLPVTPWVQTALSYCFGVKGFFKKCSLLDYHDLI